MIRFLNIQIKKITGLIFSNVFYFSPPPFFEEEERSETYGQAGVCNVLIS